MPQFKKGDRVVRKVAVGTRTQRVTGIVNGGVYTVSGCSGDAITLKESNEPGFTFTDVYFTKCEDALDDPLPPAPVSVHYVGCNRVDYRELRVVKGNVINLHVSDGKNNGKSIIFEPDDVLQLCYDLRRMALQIKRETGEL